MGLHGPSRKRAGHVPFRGTVGPRVLRSGHGGPRHVTSRGIARPRGPSRLTHLECARCQARHPTEAVGTCTACGGPLLCAYDLRDLEGGAPAEASLLAWAEVLPLAEPGGLAGVAEMPAPLSALPRLADELDIDELYVLQGGASPTGSVAGRELAVAAAAHAERGARAITLPTPGPEAAAAAVHARRLGLSCRVVLPAAASPAFRRETRLLGARAVAVTGDAGEALDWLQAHPQPDGDHSLAPLAEPYRVEGAKTVAFELWHRLGADGPDAIVVPTGDGLLAVGLSKGFDELRRLGLWDARRPRLVIAQGHGCAPLVRALGEGEEAAVRWDDARRTLAEGLRVPAPPASDVVLRAVRASDGLGVKVPEVDLVAALRRAARSDGVLVSAEGAVGLAGLLLLQEEHRLDARRVVVVDPAGLHRSEEALAAAATG